MLTTLSWQEIALRLALAFVTGTLIGIDRGEHRRPAGLRTTVLLTLAACLAMLQANVLMNTVGKSSDSFVVLDLMRLPLGILSGVGFIGAGAILKRGDLVLGVTTAATMWFVTVMGLCFGGGQIGLGITAFALAMFVLSVMRWLERLLPRQHRARLKLMFAAEAFSERELRASLERNKYGFSSWSMTRNVAAGICSVDCDLKWRSRDDRKETPSFVEEWSHRPGVSDLEWKEVT